MDQVVKAMTAECEASPVALAAGGRQRVGKTALIRAVHELATLRGARPAVWNLDVANDKTSLNLFVPDALNPGRAVFSEQRLWIEENIERWLATDDDLLIDVGGGWTAFSSLAEEADLRPAIEESGRSLVMAFVLGTDPGDLAYLDSLRRRTVFRPDRTLIVLNEGLVTDGRSPRSAFASIIQHPVVLDATAGGAQVVMFPTLACMSQVTERGLSFTDFVAGRQVDGFPRTSAINRLRVRRWLETELPACLRDVKPGFLPRLPGGATY